MSIVFTTDLPRPEGTTEAPCLCAQMGQGFILMMRGEDSAEIRADLTREADAGCPSCQGTGVENVPVESSHQLDFANDNANRVLVALGLPQEYGQCPIADARRAIMRARNTELGHLVRDDQTIYGAPRRQANGAIEMRPVRVQSQGLSLDGLNQRLDRFEAFVQSAAAAGATEIFWG